MINTIMRILIVAFALMVGNLSASALQAYYVVSNEGTTLTFYYDNLNNVRNGKPIHSNYLKNEKGTVTSVVFDKTFSNCTDITSTKKWFEDFSKLTEVTGTQYFNTSNVTDMSEMFYNCSSLTSLDLSCCNTEKVTNMNNMFYGCKSLKSLNLGNFNTTSVTDMHAMFRFCSSLTILDVSSFNTKNVIDMSLMFYSCSSLTSLNLNNFDTENVTTMSCMFKNCTSLSALDISSFNTTNMTRMDAMFTNCSSLIILDLSSFNTEKVTAMFSMFRDCSSLTTIYAGYRWSTNNIQSGGGFTVFDGCYNLVGGQGTKCYGSGDYTMAHIDLGAEGPGYLTYKDPTSIRSIERENFQTNTWFSLDGMRIKNPISKGIYIKDGKKMLMIK